MVCGASLAHHGLLGSVKDISLDGVNLSEVPTRQLVSLVSCVTRYISVENISGCDLVSILTSFKCEVLSIKRQSLGREETQALVQAMESRLEIVMLQTGVTLDIEALAEYSGQGVCRKVDLWAASAGDTVYGYIEELRNWARTRNWKVVNDESGIFEIRSSVIVM